MKCPNCGKQIAEDSLFCEYCGVKITKQPQKKKWVWWVLCIVILAIVGVAVVVENDDSNKEEYCVEPSEPVYYYSSSDEYVVGEECDKEEEVAAEPVEVAEAIVEVSDSYLYTDENNFEIEHYGGEEYGKWIYVNSNCSWYISTPVASWAHTLVSGDYIKVWCDFNSNDPRSDYFVISSYDGNATWRIDFTQK